MIGEYKTHVPDGVEDCLPAECYIKRKIEKSLRDNFILCGFEEIETPTYEFYDAFQSGVGSYMQESMIKFVDSKGRILVLRPDMTVPIARVAATKLGEGVQRLFYIQNSFTTASPAFGKAGEFTQAGIEIIGDGCYTADAEVIALAVKSLINAGLESFTIDIGQVAFFKGLINGIGLKDEEIDELRHAVDSKDTLAIEAISAKHGIDKTLSGKLTELPNLFGDEEVFEKALELSHSKECKKAVENLKNIFDLLSSLGLKDYISIDFSMLHDIAYYSGMVFRGISPGIGFPIVSGGRYDELISKFGEKRPATGFALGIKRTMIAMERQELLSGYYETYAVISADEKFYKAAYEYAEELRKEGKRVIMFSGIGKDELNEKKKQTGALKAVYITANGEQQII